MTNTRAAKGLVWIDLTSPTEEEISSLVVRYGLHPLVGEELRTFDSTTRIDLHKEYLLVVLTVPVRVKEGGAWKTVDREIDFVLGRNYLITAHEDGIEQLEYFAKVFETNAILNKDSKIETTAHLFYYMVMRLYSGICDDLRNIRDALQEAERSVFSGHERKMVEVLSYLSRELVDFREIARTHRDVWNELVQYSDAPFLGDGFLPYVRDIRDEFNSLHELIQSARELVGDLRETNDSLLNTKQNDIMRTLTIINFIFIPATFISALFTIPASFVPVIGAEFGWMYIFAGMVAITLAIWYAIRRKGWI